MTIKEFSIKYDIPYHMAYEASYGVQPVTTPLKDRDYREADLYQGMTNLIRHRMKRQAGMIRKYRGIAEKMERRRAG